MSPESLLEVLTSPQSWDWRITTILAVLVPFIITYIITSWQAIIATAAAKNEDATVKDPVVLPYSFPVVGHLISLLSNGDQVLKHGTRKYGTIPFQICLGPTYRIYMISGAEMTTAFFKESRRLTGMPTFTKAMGLAFDCGPKAAKFYLADDSGMLPTPYPTSTVKPETG